MRFNPFLGVCWGDFKIKTKSHIANLAKYKIEEIVKNKITFSENKKEIYSKKEVKYEIKLERSFNVVINFKSFSGIWKIFATIETDNSGIRVLEGYISDCGELIYYRDTI